MVARAVRVTDVEPNPEDGERTCTSNGRYEEYHPFGTTSWWATDGGTEVSAKRYRYTGKERDDETGLGHHGARYYAAWLGRWERPDPIGLKGGINRYSYVRNRPTSLNDPTGTVDSEVDEDVDTTWTDQESGVTYHSFKSETGGIMIEPVERPAGAVPAYSGIQGQPGVVRLPDTVGAPGTMLPADRERAPERVISWGIGPRTGESREDWGWRALTEFAGGLATGTERTFWEKAGSWGAYLDPTPFGHANRELLEDFVDDPGVGTGGAVLLAMAHLIVPAPSAAVDYTSVLTRSGNEARRTLRGALGLVRGSGSEAHHIIPLGLRDHKVELTRFRGHPRIHRRGCPHGAQDVHPRVQGPPRVSREEWPHSRVAGEGVRTVGSNHPGVGRRRRPRRGWRGSGRQGCPHPGARA
ncbi:MAG: RHS repeat-associated core domain-containing protein [Alphaproteobacteria bacterium]|nr:RHS repeat-associated core domain-containing protein [Alphaproteobacteria bacterium]